MNKKNIKLNNFNFIFFWEEPNEYIIFIDMPILNI